MQRWGRSDLEGTFRRIAIGARLLGIGWFALLAVLALLQEGERTTGPQWVVGPLVVAVLWAGVSTIRARRDPDSSISRAAVAVDLALATLTLLAPDLAGIPDVSFYGGYPLIVVAIAALRSGTAGWAAAGVFVAVVVFRAPAQGLTEVLVGSISQIITYLAAAFIFGWAVRVLRMAETERGLAADAAARAEERAEISRHLHDSVLQTLALVQRSADRPEEVVALARRQERDLREWLYGTPRPPDAGLADGIRAAAAEVEEQYKLTIDVVAVGDAPMSSRVEAVVAAAKEAMVNAAKHSGAGTVSVYAEARPGSVTVFVRDRGVGFDPDAVPPDRRGIVESIRGRLQEAGGEASLRSEQGRGVEWRMEVRP